MKITSYLEQEGFRLEVTLESKDLITHSIMQGLTEEQENNIYHQLSIAANYTVRELILVKREEKNNDIFK